MMQCDILKYDETMGFSVGVPQGSKFSTEQEVDI